MILFDQKYPYLLVRRFFFCTCAKTVLSTVGRFTIFSRFAMSELLIDFQLIPNLSTVLRNTILRGSYLAVSCLEVPYFGNTLLGGDTLLGNTILGSTVLGRIKPCACIYHTLRTVCVFKSTILRLLHLEVLHWEVLYLEVLYIKYHAWKYRTWICHVYHTWKRQIWEFWTCKNWNHTCFENRT